MATRNSDIYAKQADPKLGNRNLGIRETGVLLFLTATYTMVGTEAANDLINIGTLKQGSIIDPSHCTVVSDAIATTATIDVGDNDVAGVGAAADPDRYADGLDVAAAGVDRFDSIAAAARLTPYALGADSIIQAKFATLVTPVAGKKLVFRIGYLAAV
jgi:hypothetical protein